MTVENQKELSSDQVRAHLADKVFVVDTQALKDSNNALINGGFTFLNTLFSYTLGKVYFVTSEEESVEDLVGWINHWRISSHQLFMRPQVWDPNESIPDLVSSLSNADSGGVIAITNSSKLEKTILDQCPGVFKIMKVNNNEPNFNYHRVWLKFYNPEFWIKN